MKLVGHVGAGVALIAIARQLELPIDVWGVLLGGLLPDADFLLFVLWLGRVRGHRTITHSPAFLILLAWLLRHRFGFSSVLISGLVHSLLDDCHSLLDDYTLEHHEGIAWLWPLSLRRFSLLAVVSGHGTNNRHPYWRPSIG